MPESELLSPRQVAEYLSVNAEEVSELVQDGKLTAYRIGGSFLRFKREEVLQFREGFLKARYERERSIGRTSHGPRELAPHRAPSMAEQIGDFWYFNSFYIYSGIVAAILLFIIFK